MMPETTFINTTRKFLIRKSAGGNFCVPSESWTREEDEQENWNFQEDGLSTKILSTLTSFSEDYTIQEFGKVYNYILDHSENTKAIFELLHSAFMLKLKYFGEEGQILVSINNDPEMKDEFLKVTIRTSEYDSSFLKKLRQLRNDFSSQMAQKNFWIFINSDFKEILSDPL